MELHEFKEFTRESNYPSETNALLSTARVIIDELELTTYQHKRLKPLIDSAETFLKSEESFRRTLNNFLATKD